MPNCKQGKSKLCGRACISIAKTCRKDPVVPGTTTNCAPKKPRKEPTCTEGRSYKCGKACIAVTRPCRKTNTPAPRPLLPPEGREERLNAMWTGLQPPNVRVRNRQGDWVPEHLGDACAPDPFPEGVNPFSQGCTPCRRQTGPNSAII